MKRIILFIAITLLCVSCEYSSETVSILAEEIDNLDDPRETDINNYCFRNEFRVKEYPNSKDVEELSMEVKGNAVSGAYNWLPAFKDQRLGKFTGYISDGIVTARYMFMQEGIENDAIIKIALKKNEVTITGGPLELGLAVTIKKVPCGE